MLVVVWEVMQTDLFTLFPSLVNEVWYKKFYAPFHFVLSLYLGLLFCSVVSCHSDLIQCLGRAVL